MGIRVFVREIGKKKGEVRLGNRATVADLLKLLGYNREIVVTRLGGKVVIERERLRDGDSIEIIKVVTGG